MAKSAIVYQPKIDAKTIIAELEERSTQIKELEREVEAQAGELARQKARIESIATERDDFKSYWESALQGNSHLQKIIASLDVNAIAQVHKEHTYLIADKDGEIRQLREDLHRCLGWIDARLDKHPIPSRPEPGGYAKSGIDPGSPDGDKTGVYVHRPNKRIQEFRY